MFSLVSQMMDLPGAGFSALDRRARGFYKAGMHHRHSSLRRRFAGLPPAGKAAVAALAAAGVLRLAQAWAWRALDGPEPVAVALAARRLAHGGGWPLLGPPPWRMGTPETVLGGMLFTVLGESGFAAGLATALFGFAALWALWRWARSAAGETGGLLAVLAALFGPPGHFAAQASPMGGWMAALAFECLLLAQATRMADDLRDRWEPSLSAYAGLGLLAGLGVWTTRLSLPAVLVALWVLDRATQGRWKKHWKGLLAMCAGTLPGLAAWLSGLALASGAAPCAEAAVLRPGAWWRIAEAASGFLRFGGAPVPRAMAAVLVLLAAAGFWQAWMAAHRRRAGGHHEHNPPRSAAAALALLQPAWFAACGGGAAGDGRIWMLWMPPLAILAAVACTAPRARWLRRASLALLLAAVAWQAALGGVSLAAHAAESARLGAERRAVAAALAERGATALLAPRRDYPLNFHLAETVAVSDGSPACDPAVLRKAELSQSPAWAAEFPGIGDWASANGVRADVFTAAGRTFLAGLQAPLPDLREWPKPPHRAGAAVPAGALAPAPESVLSDGRLDTWLEGRGGALSLEWRFPAPLRPAALRLLFDDRGGPARFAAVGAVRIEYLRGGEWSPTAELALPPLETSLGRPYPPSPLCFRTLPLPAPQPPADGLRATLLDASGAPGGAMPWRLAEIALYTAPGEGGGDAASADRLPALVGDATLGDLRAHLANLPSSTPVYAPRRLAGRLADAGVLPARRLGLFFESSADTAMPEDRAVCLCVETRLADAALLALGAADRAAETRECGPWTLFLLQPPDLAKRLPGTLLRWAGDLPVADIDFAAVDRLTEIILGKLQGQKTRLNERLKAQYESDPVASASGGGAGGPAKVAAPAIRWREEPGAALPDFPESDSSLLSAPALAPEEELKTLRFIRQLSLVRPQSLAVLPEEIVYQAGGADLLGLRARAGVRPIRPMETVFRDGLVLQGIDAVLAAAAPGADVALTLYWQASGEPRTAPETTLLQLCTPGGAPVASAEWTGPANVPGYPDFAIPLRECRTETVALTLPGDLPPGPLQVRVGRRRAGHPVPVKSTGGVLPPDASSACLDGLLSVAPR